MKAVYYTTRNFIRHQGNVVDLEEYRRRMARVDGNLALAQPEEIPQPRPRRVHASARPRACRGLSDWLNMAAGAVTTAVALGAWLGLML